MKRGLLAVLLMVTLASRSKADVPSDRNEIRAKALPNGLLWIHKRVKHNRIVAFRLLLPGGSLDESARQAGLTTLMTSVMFKGTSKKNALQLAQEIESLGASLGAGGEEDFWQVSGQATADKIEATFRIFREVLLEPSFPAEEVEKEKAAQLNAIRAKKESIFDVAFDRMQRELFGDHPYGWPEEGTEETVAAFTPEDLRLWHRAHANPKGAVLVTVGDVAPAKLEPWVKGLFDGAGEGESPAVKAVPPRFPAKPASVEEEHPFEQSFVMLAYPAPGVTDGDYAAIKVLNAHLGAGMSSPLFQSVREEGGLAYDVSSFFPSRKLASALVVYAGTDPKNVDKAHAQIKETIAQLLREPLSAEALADAKRYIRGHYKMDHQTNGKIAWYLGWWEILGKTYLHDAAYLKNIDAVTAADARRVAEHLLTQTPTVVKIRSKKQ